jgi:hemoglobin-like flavoprotein
MYKFGPEFKGNEEELYKSEIFKAHARGVVQMLDATVNMLGPDLKPATKTLTMLGVRHIKYGVLPAHYGIVGEALLYTLETALGDKWTPLVKKGWVGIYTFVSSAMMAGADHEVQRKLKRKQGRKTKNQSSSPVRQSSSPVRRDGPKKPSDQLASGEVRRRRRPPNNPLPRTAARLSDITGIPEVAGMAERRPNYSKFIDDALLDVSNHSVRTTETSSTPDTEEPLDEVSYYHMVENVYASWDKVRRIPNYAEVAGVLLFKE